MEKGSKEVVTSFSRHGPDLLRCVVVTPEATVLDVAARFVALPLFDGEIGIAPRHSPLIGRLGYGEMRVSEPSETRSFFVDGGFVQVADDCVSVLTGRAVPADAIDVEVVGRQLDDALKRPARGEERMSLRARHVSQSRAQLRVARRAAARRRGTHV